MNVFERSVRNHERNCEKYEFKSTCTVKVRITNKQILSETLDPGHWKSNHW